MLENGNGYRVAGRRVVVMGLKRSGESVIRLLVRRGAQVLGLDSDPTLRPDKTLTETDRVSLRLGAHRPEDFDGADLVVISPGIPADTPALSGLRQRGVPVIGELELAASFLKTGNVLAITGTNGKSTTTTLLGEIFKEAGKSVFVGGNLGIPASDAVRDDSESPYDAVILEVSSFQLETVVSFRPEMAALLNISPDHGERYARREDYVLAKMALFKNQDSRQRAFLNWDDPLIRECAAAVRSSKIWFSTKADRASGLYFDHGTLFLNNGGATTPLYRTGKSVLTGNHNRENIAVAAGMAFFSGIRPGVIQTAIDQFRGLPHRMEKIRSCRGVTFIDDSKATNVGAVVRSLQSTPAPIILIAGGKEKGGGFADLQPLVRDKVKEMIVIGEARENMIKDLRTATRVRTAESIEEAVQIAFQASEEGDTVLLSPACASYDMFRDYADRGNRFRIAVDRLN